MRDVKSLSLQRPCTVRIMPYLVGWMVGKREIRDLSRRFSVRVVYGFPWILRLRKPQSALRPISHPINFWIARQSPESRIDLGMFRKSKATHCDPSPRVLFVRVSWQAQNRYLRFAVPKGRRYLRYATIRRDAHFSILKAATDYRAAKGLPRTVVYIASNAPKPLMFATPPTVIGSPRY